MFALDSYVCHKKTNQKGKVLGYGYNLHSAGWLKYEIFIESFSI